MTDNLSSANLSSVVAIDVGNSRVKVGVFEEFAVGDPFRRPTQTFRWGHAEACESPEWPRVAPEAVVIGSVAPLVSERLVATLPSDWPTPHLAGFRDYQISNRITEPARVGIDRLANTAAASVLSHRCRCVVVDAGTAITVDVVDGDGCFAGGAIFPGIQMAADALTSRTALIPRVVTAPRFDDVGPGTNTDEAIRAGVQFGVVGACEAIVSRFQSQLTTSTDEAVPVFLCGGNADFLVEASRSVNGRFVADQVVESLTLYGLAMASRR